MRSKILAALGLMFFLGDVALAEGPFIFSGDSIQSLVTFGDGPLRIQSDLLYTDPALPIAWGGTGQTTANSALNALLPPQTGNAGYFLTTDGTDTSWIAGGLSNSIPSAHQGSTSVVTSATTTYVDAITTTITMTAISAPIYAKATATLTTTTAASVAKYRVLIDGVAGQEQLVSLTATATNYTAAAQYTSASLGPGTYTVKFQIARNSGTGTVNFFEGNLDAIGLQGAVGSNGMTQISGLGLNAGPGSGLQSLTGTLSLAGGGTNASLTAANGAIPYSTATAMALLAPGSVGQIFRSGGAGAPTWTSETFPSSTTINQLLYSSANNVVSGLATANTGFLRTSSTGVPSVVACTTANRLARTDGTNMSCAQAVLTTDVTGTLPFANGGTGATSFPVNRIPFSNGTNFVSDGNLLYATATTRFSVGNPGSAKINATVPVANSDLGIQAFCEGTNNCMQIRSNNAYNIAALNANDSNALGGVLWGAERSRGSQTARTQALTGDGELNLVGSCYTGSASSTGFTASIQYVLSENCTAGGNGGEMVFNTTPNGATAVVERMRITNDGLVKSQNGFLIDTSGAQPTCDSAHRGLTWLVQGGAGVADLFQVCMKDAADNYSWVTK